MAKGIHGRAGYRDGDCLGWWHYHVAVAPGKQLTSSCPAGRVRTGTNRAIFIYNYASYKLIA